MNLDSIIAVCRQIEMTGKSIQVSAESLKSQSDSDLYETILFDNVSHIQILTLELMQLVSNGNIENTDSVFAQGELDYNSGVEIENPVGEEDE